MKKILTIGLLLLVYCMAQGQEPCYDTKQEELSMCENLTGKSWRNGKVLKTAGIYRDTVKFNDEMICDSIYEVTFTVHQLPEIKIDGKLTICNGDSTTLTATGGRSYIWTNVPEAKWKRATSASITVHTDGTYTVNGTDRNGCYANVTAKVTVYDTYNTDSVTSTCSASPCNFYGQICAEDGEYTHVLKSEHNCDSTIHLKLTVYESPALKVEGARRLCTEDTLLLIAQGGDSYVWSTNDSTDSCKITVSGEYTVTAYSPEGCTTSETMTINEYPTYHENEYAEICYGESYLFYGREETRNGDHLYTTPTKDGCDSNVTLHLTVKPITNQDSTAYVRDTFTWNDVGYNQSGAYMQRFKRQDGCDSIIILYLTVIHGKPLPKIVVCDNRLLMVEHYEEGDTLHRKYEYSGYRWYCNGKLIKKSTLDNYHTANYGTLKGCYHVEVATDETLSEWIPSDTICINYTGIEDIEQNIIQINPNPAQHGTEISINCAQPGKLKIYDMQGRCRMTETVYIEDKKIVMPNERGVYLITLIGEDGIQHSGKIIVR